MQLVSFFLNKKNLANYTVVEMRKHLKILSRWKILFLVIHVLLKAFE